MRQEPISETDLEDLRLRAVSVDLVIRVHGRRLFRLERILGPILLPLLRWHARRQLRRIR